MRFQAGENTKTLKVNNNFMGIPNAVDEGMNTCKRECLYCGCIIHYNQVFSDEGVELVPIEEYYSYKNELDENGHTIFENGIPRRVEVLYTTTRCPAHEGLSLNDLHVAIAEEDQVIMKTSLSLIENLPEDQKEEIIDRNTGECQGFRFKVDPVMEFDEDRNLMVTHPASEEIKEAVTAAVDEGFGEGKLLFQE